MAVFTLPGAGECHSAGSLLRREGEALTQLLSILC
jgi:hypothetical protein